MSDKLLLQELKRLIILKNEIKNPSPSDCRFIAADIHKNLRKTISETTLKRLFGFASVKHEFSKFTINTLMEYTGIVEDDVKSELLIFNNYEKGEEIDLVRAKAKRISNCTLLNIKNRCTVPYELTIGRDFANEELAIFTQSEYSYTLFISQPGYGKSILLSHLIQDMFMGDNSIYKKHVILFINADHIFNSDLADLTLEDRIKLKLGLLPNTSLISYFDEQFRINGAKFFFAVDGLSDMIITKHLKPKIFDRIIDFISTIADSENVKVILNMRSTTWSRFYERIRFAPFFKNKWYAGSYYQSHSASNVPPLTPCEVEQIFNKISPSTFTPISEELKQQLKFPFHIQWYYQLRTAYPNFESYTNIVYFEIIAKFILEKIYNSTYATEKVLFCKKIIFLTNYGQKTFKVAKLDLMNEMPVFKNAYSELLSDGIITEDKRLEKDEYVEYVRFIQPHVFEYFQFIELYDLFGQKIDDRFFDIINKEYTGNQSRFQLLQWAVRFLVKRHQFKTLNLLLNLDLSNFEKNYLLYFIAENLKYRTQINPAFKLEIENQNFHQMLIKHLIHFDFIDTSYNQAIACLIEVADNEKTALIYQSTLVLFDCLGLDEKQIKYRLTKLKDLQQHVNQWIIDPYEATELIYNRLWGKEKIQNSVLQSLEDFKSLKNVYPVSKLPNASEAISYFFMLSVNYLYGSQKEVAQIVAAIFYKHPKLKKPKNPIAIYLLSFLTLASARTNPSEQTDQMERILTNLLEKGSKYTSASYARSLLLCIKAEQSKNRKEYEMAIYYAEEFLKIHQTNELAVHQLAAYNLLIQIYQLLNQQSKAEKCILKKNDLLVAKNIPIGAF